MLTATRGACAEQNVTLVLVEMFIGPYEIYFIYLKNFSVSIFIDPVLMVKLKNMNQKACLFN